MSISHTASGAAQSSSLILAKLMTMYCGSLVIVKACILGGITLDKNKKKQNK